MIAGIPAIDLPIRCEFPARPYQEPIQIEAEPFILNSGRRSIFAAGLRLSGRNTSKSGAINSHPIRIGAARPLPSR